MAQRPSPRGEPSGVPVVLCCALGEDAEVEEVGRTLRERGVPVEVLVGVELDPRALATAIDRWRGEGLYVLCRAGALDRTRIDALREVLLARRVPFGRTLTVGSSTRKELLERVEQGLKKVVPTARPSSVANPAASGTSASESSGTVRPRRQTIPVIPASVTRTLQGGPRPAAATTPPVAKPATSPAITRASPPALPRKAESKPAPVGLSSQANEETQSGAAAHEETTTSDPTQEETTTSEPALGAAPERDPEPTQASAQSEAGASDGEPDDVTFAGSIDADAASEPTVEPTQTKRPDTSVTAVELDADMLDEDDEDVTRLRPPKHDDDELPSIDLDGMLAGIGDGPDLAARGNTVIARGDTVIARADALPRATALPRVHTLKAAALPVEGYPDDANELSLSDGEVLVDRTLVTPARPPPPPLGLTSTMPTPKTPAPPLEDAPSGGSGKLLVAGVIGALALGVLVAVIVSGRNDTDTTARTDTASTEIADAAKSGAQPDEAKSAATPLADAKGEPQSDPPANPDNDAPAEPVVKADPAAKPSPSEAVRDPSGTRPALATATVKPAAKLPTTARAPAVLPPPKTKVQAALRAREVRALDILLVARKPTRPLAFADATRHCSALDVRGIQGWRLPDVGELASLGSAGMLARGVYWSQTSGDTFGDTHMAWNGRTGQAASRIKGAVALCVRGDRGEAQ